MSTPDLVTAVRRQLVATPSVTSTLGPRTGNPATVWTSWIFAWRDYVRVEGTGSALAILRINGGAPANDHNTMRFPTLVVEVQADPDRQNDKNPNDVASAARKAITAMNAIDAVLHRPSPEALMWGAGGPDNDTPLRIVRSVRMAEPTLLPVPGTDGVMASICSYEVHLG